jgi:hypothetical protein
MAYWVKRILLKSGEIVTERELRPDENASEGPTPAVGEKLTVACRDRTFETRVIWGSWPGRAPAPDVVVPPRVEEL